MTRDIDDILAAAQSADHMPYGPARTETMVRLLDEVDRDALQDAEAYVLICLVEAHFFAGDTARALVVFSRLRRLWAEHPERFDQWDREAFFAAMNWVVGGVQDDPSVSAAQILPLLDDMTELAAVAGLAADAAAYERLRWAIRSESDDVEARFEEWRHTPRTTADCEFCERTRVAMVFARDGRFAETVTLASAPGAPDRRCSTDPADMYSLHAQALLEVGDAVGAARLYRDFEAALPRQSAHLTMARGRRIWTLGRGGALELAVAAIEEDQDYLLGGITGWLHLSFLTSVAAGTSALVRAGLDAPLRLRVVPAATVSELADWTRERALELADAFGARAGGDRLRARTLADIERPLPPQPLEFRVAVPAPVSAEAPAPTAEDHGGALTDESAAETWEQALAAAEAVVSTDLTAAAAAYGRAAVLADAAGALADAGFAYAELGRSADLLRDPAASHRAYGESVARLIAAGVEPELTVQVIEAWAPVAADRDDTADVATAAARIHELLAVANDEDVPDERLRARRAHRRVSALAVISETRARLIAGDDADLAFDLALRAAELHRDTGRADAAADALWLAARIRESVGAADTPDVMRLAFDASSGHQRSVVGAALVEALRGAGRHGDADDVLRELGGN
ncbi:hypothetical protein [Microbacterium sp. ZW T5_56]|uniref:hypothetical protein n=1 Tax=Microbacterium sp. ZW T5_56 TaxID=3378081 RepID=UPI003853FD51